MSSFASRRRLSGLIAVTVLACSGLAAAASPWAGDLAPITPADWNRARAAHLLERAGFGGTPEEVDALAKLTPAQAVRRLVRFEGVPKTTLPTFEHSDRKSVV